MSRVRRANELAIEKTTEFLADIKYHYDCGFKFNSNELHKKHEISKSTFSIVKKLGFFENGKWIVEDPNRQQALSILEVLRQQASKRIDVALSDDFVSAIDRLTTSMNTLSLQNEKSLKSPLLSRALNQAEQSHGNHLFSQVESDESKKFELLKAIASRVYTTVSGLTNDQDIEIYNLGIIEATEDLFNKFFQKK